MSVLKGGADLPDPEHSPLPEEEQAVIEKLARKTVEKRMSVPAIMFLESVKPLNFIGAQTMVFFEPVIQAVFNFRDYNTLREALEKRETIEILIQRIEAHDAVAVVKEKAFRKWYRQEKKKWKWYQRYLGVGRPKLNPPDEVLNPPELAQAPTDDSDGQDKTG